MSEHGFTPMIIVEQNFPKQRWNEYMLRTYLWVTFSDPPETYFAQKLNYDRFGRSHHSNVRDVEAEKVPFGKIEEDEIKVEKTFGMDLFVDIKSRFTDTHTQKEVRYERDKERLLNQLEENSQGEGEEESLIRRDNNERHFWPTGERFIDYMAYEAGLLKLSDIVALEDLMLQMKPSDKLEHALLRPEQSTWQFFIR